VVGIVFASREQEERKRKFETVRGSGIVRAHGLAAPGENKSPENGTLARAIFLTPRDAL
jgi:hypothetical protein